MTSTKERCAKLKDEILSQLAEQIKALQLGQQSADVIGDGEYTVTSKNIHLQCLLDLLDHILFHGLVNVEYGYWPFVSKYTHSETVRIITSHPQVTNDLDKGRVWIFMAISECVLESYIRMFLDEQKAAKKFYSKYAFLRDRERLGILQTLVSGLDFIGVALDQNTPYLGYGGIGNSPCEGVNESKPSVLPGSNNVHINKRPGHSREGSVSVSSSVSTCSTLTAPTSPASTGPSDTDSIDTAIGSLSLAQKTDSKVENKNVDTRNTYELKPVSRTNESNTISSNTVNSANTANEKVSHSPVTEGEAPSRCTSTDQELLSFMDPKFLAVEEGGVHAFDRSISEEFRPRFGSNLSEISMDEVDIVFRHEQKKAKRYARRISSRKRNQRVPVGGANLDESLLSPGDAAKEQDHSSPLRADQSSEIQIRASSFVSDNTGDTESLGSSVVSGDSLDQFCRDADFGSSFNLSTELGNESTVHECHNDESMVHECHNDQSTVMIEDDLPKDEEDGDSIDLKSQALVRSTDYEGIILGLPKRPSLQDMPGNLCDVSLDPNTVLLLSLEIFKHSDEQFQKMFHATTGHQFGQLQSAYVMLTNYAIYLLRKVSFREEASFHTDMAISYAILRKLEIGLNCQTVTISSKNQQFTISFGDEASSRSFITSLTAHVSRASAAPSLSNLVSSTAVQQETAISKWMAQQDKLKMANSSTVCYSLIHWCGLAGPDAQIEVVSVQSVMEGTLEYKQHQYLGMSSRWTTGYFVLTNGTLWQYTNQNDKAAKFSIDLRGTRCGGCRQIHDADRPFAFEIVSSDGTGSLLVLSAKTEHEACEWIFKICQSIAESYDNDDDRGYTVMRCVPCCVITTKEEIVVCLSQPNTDNFQLVSRCSVQSVTRIYVDNEFRNYCIMHGHENEVKHYCLVFMPIVQRVTKKFEYSELHEAEASWLLWFRTDYELGKFERAVAEAWRELFQVDLQFLVLGDVPTRQEARERVRKIEHHYTVNS